MRVFHSTYCGFPSIELEWMEYRLSITPSIGGRILGFAYKDNQLFYIMPHLMGKTFDLSLQNGETIDEKRKELGMKLYGGFKTWLAPQSLWQNAPYIDLDLGIYNFSILEKEDAIMVTLESPICRQTAMQFIRRVRIRKNQEEVEIEMGMKNHDNQTVTYGLWDVTQVVSPGYALFEAENKHAIQNLSNTAAPLKWVDKKVLEVNCRQEYGMFKVGNSSSTGNLLSVVETENGKVGYLKTFEVFENPIFGHGCATEVYNSVDYPYFEAEVHSPLITLEPNESFFTKQTWKCHYI